MEGIFDEVREVIEGEQGVPIDAKIIQDKKTGQFSVKIPRKIADRARLENGDTMRFLVKFDKLEDATIKPRLSAWVLDDGEKEK